MNIKVLLNSSMNKSDNAVWVKYINLNTLILGYWEVVKNASG